MGFVALPQPGQDLFGLGNARLFHQDLLEAPLESGILGQVLAVLIERGGADGLDLTPGKGRFEDGGGIDGALRGAGAHQVVELIDEQDDIPALADLLHDLLEALLELTPVLGPGYQRPQVEGVDLLVFQEVGDVVPGDALRQPLHDSSLAYARLTHQHRVVLGTAGEDLHHPLYLRLPPDDRVELVFLGVLGEVAPELVEHLGALALLALSRGVRDPSGLTLGRARKHPHHFLPHPIGVDLQIAQDPSRRPFALPHQAQQDMLGADVVVS